MQTRKCIDCGAELEYTRGRPPVRCAICKAIRARERATDWYRSNPERVKAQRSRSPEWRRENEKYKPRCAFEGCPNPYAYADGYCRTHHSQVLRKGEVEPVKHRVKRNNITPRGYRKVRDGGKQRFEHRVVLERLLGRPLQPWENVHHINGVRHDNRPANLELWVTPQPSGQRPEDIAAWLVEHYPEAVRQALADYTQKENTNA